MERTHSDIDRLDGRMVVETVYDGDEVRHRRVLTPEQYCCMLAGHLYDKVALARSMRNKWVKNPDVGVRMPVFFYPDGTSYRYTIEG